MQLPEMQIRPRGNWESVDLGVRLAQRHLPQLMLSWACLTLPVFLLLTALLWDYPSVVLLLFWWLKPLFDRLPLFILSRALFGNTPSLRQSLRALPGQLRRQWFASLTWRRLTPTRSFDLPVTQLEGLEGKARQQRLAVLGQRTSRTASWLTLVGYHLEVALTLGLLALLYVLLPSGVIEDWEWQDLISASDQWLWLEHLSNALYALVLIVWEPVYVACGFSLYLNRRTELEGWDIELGFRRLRERVRPAAAALLALLLCIGLFPASEPLQAAEREAASQSQPLTRAAAREAIEAIAKNPPFEHRQTVTGWRLSKQDEAEDKTDGSAFLRLLQTLRTMREFFNGLAPVTETLLWIAVFGLIAVVAWRYRDWLRLFGGRILPTTRRSPPSVMFGLEVTPESLPEDVATEAERLWSRSSRQALSLLYRGTLSHLLHVCGLPLKASHTEAEILALLGAPHVDLHAYAAQLTGHWQNVAYGHREVPADACSELCNGYRRLIRSGGAA